MQIHKTITPDAAREARAKARLSQARVAKDTGISRTKLALFEVQKYLLDDQDLTALRDYFCGLDVLDEQALVTPHGRESNGIDVGCSVLDGFAVPAGLDQELVENALEEICANDQQIMMLARNRAERDWLIFPGDKKQRNEIVRLMARNYLLTRYLQGREAVEQSQDDFTNGDAVVELIGETND